MSGAPLVRGLALSERYYQEAVRPILESRFPGLEHSAALLGQGSEVLGFDTAQSMDHDWGLRLMLFLAEGDHSAVSEAIHGHLQNELPDEFCGFPTRFVLSPARAEEGNVSEAARHQVTLLTVRGFFLQVLGFDPLGPIGVADWLSVPEQNLLSVTSGAVFHDGLGQLEAVRSRLHYYPRDVWLYLLAAQWRRMAQEEHFVGRCGQVGDELGSRLIASRLVQDLMRLGFLMERRYAPYIKWLGTAFAQLSCAKRLGPILLEVLRASTWPEREKHLGAAYELMAGLHNALGITQPLPIAVTPFWDRPFQIIHGDRFVDAIRAAIQDPEVRALPEHLGSVDQFVDSTDALRYLDRLKVAYQDPDAVC